MEEPVMAKKKTTSPGYASSQPVDIQRIIRWGIAGAFIVLIGVFIITGADPLGFFSTVENTPTVVATLPITTPGAGEDASAWWQVYFTDPNTINDPNNMKGSIEEKLIAYIDGAKKSIHVAAFEFNLTPVAEALIRADKRGVEVQWVTDDENGIDADTEEGHGQFAMLEKAGIKVKDDGRSALMHNKFWIFDGGIVWTGSTNITVNGNFHNNNNVIIIRSQELAVIYEREFQEMWAGKFGTTSPSTVSDQKLNFEGVPIQVLFAAEDDTISHLIPLIEGAKKSIRFMAFSFTHNDMTAAMLARSKAGVDIQGIFETRGSETEYSAMIPLYCANIPVRQDGNPATFHHKVIIIDDRILITGSLNFSDNADTSNDENTLIITSPEIASRYLEEFAKRWEEATNPDKNVITCAK
jgi:phosphatidylserine/phosphatidylglycerophosphate/cardiolipin synthase-like enzyme